MEGEGQASVTAPASLQQTPEGLRPKTSRRPTGLLSAGNHLGLVSLLDPSYSLLTLSARRLASLACCSQASALSMALSFSSFMACIFFLMASMATSLVGAEGGGAARKAG